MAAPFSSRYLYSIPSFGASLSWIDCCLNGPDWSEMDQGHLASVSACVGEAAGGCVGEAAGCCARGTAAMAKSATITRNSGIGHPLSNVERHFNRTSHEDSAVAPVRRKLQERSVR